MLPQVAIGLLLSLVGGILLVLIGLRGRRLNDHPICRWCTFDLSGCPEGTVTCPECGAGLKRDRAIRIGQRRRLYSCIAAGGIALAIPVSLFAFVGYSLITASNINRHKPVGILLWEARLADAARAGLIADELHDRALNRRLSESQYHRIVESILERQADPDLPWTEMWGEIVERAWLDGELSEEQRDRFHAQAPVLQWHARPRVRAGDPVPIVADLVEKRIGSTTSLAGQTVLVEATIGGQATAPTRRLPGSPYAFFTSGPMGWFYLMGSASRQWGEMPSVGGSVLLALPGDLERGSHELIIRVGIKCEPFDFAARSWTWADVHDPDMRIVEWRTTIEIVAADDTVAEAIEPTPELTEQLKRLLSPQQTQVHESGRMMNAMQSFGAAELPVPVAFDVYWRGENNEIRIGSLTSGLAAGEMNTWWGQERYVHAQVPRFRFGQVDVILRPSEEVAAQTADLLRFYGGEIVFEDVPVQQARVTVSPGGGILQRLFGW